MTSYALRLALLLPLSLSLQAQTNLEKQAQPPNEGAQPPATSGSNTGLPQAPVLDAEHRPITAGGFVKTGPIVFQDIAGKAGLNSFHYQVGTPEKQFIVETIGSGVALLDYDNDGWLDIYLVNGSTFPAEAGKAPAPSAALFRNNHDGTFTDVTAKAGVANNRWGVGAVVGDFDNDGWPDLYVTNYGINRLYRNNHDGTFTDVAPKAGVTVGTADTLAWSTGATWGDYDGDGRLDLFVPGYVHYDLAHPPRSGTDASAIAFCQYRGVMVSCGPRGLEGEADHLFHNNGDGTFTDVSAKAGVADKPHFYGFTSTFVDVNNDGKPDLLVANDSSSNYLYLNRGNGTFEDASYTSGFALNQAGRETASMGLAVGDYRNNGLVDLYTTTFSDDYKTLFENDGDANFSEITARAGIAEITYPFLGWGTAFLDFDNDGWKDLMFVNGHMFPQVEQHQWGTTYAQRPLLFRNLDHGSRFATVDAVEGTGLATVVSARGAAFGDLFNEGKIDVVINTMDGVPVLLRNVDTNTSHWVGLQLVGGPKSPRDATGATVFLTAGGIRQRADVLSGESFMSSNDPRPHFGLGTATSVTSVEIRWPSGLHQTLGLPAVDCFFTIEEGKAPTESRATATIATRSTHASPR